MIEEWLTSRLAEFSDNVFPNKAPDDATGDMIVYSRVGSQREVHLSGPGGIVYASFQLDIYATTYMQLSILADLARGWLDGFRDELILYCSLENEFDFDADADPDGYYRRVLEFKITHTEPPSFN